MGLTLLDAEIIISKIIKAKRKPKKLLFLGDVKILFSVQEYLNLINKLKFKPKHNLPDSTEEFDAKTFGKTLGFSLVKTLDINGKADYKIDITKKIPHYILGSYDCIIDCGMLHYCFNPGLALCNISKIIPMNGMIIHIVAISGHYGRALYPIPPSTLINFYKKNDIDNICNYYRKSIDLNLIDFYCQYIKSGLIKFISYFFPNKYFFFNKNQRFIVNFESNYIENSPNFIPNNVVGIMVFISSKEPSRRIRNLFLLT